TRNAYLLARVTWAPDSRNLYVVRTNRVQDRLELLSFEIGSGKSKRVFEETDKYWMNVQDEPHFIDSGKRFLWTSERDGFRHIYLYTSDGKLIRQLTKGPWEVTAINGVDESTGRVYYTASEPSPLERHFYSVGLNGEGPKQLTSGAGTHTI